MLRGVHPLIATLIVIAVALAMALAVSAWLLGWYHGVHERYSTILRIYNATMYVYPNGTCVLDALVEVEGGKLRVLRVRVEGVNSIASYHFEGVGGLTLPPGGPYKLVVRGECNLTQGFSGRVWILGDNGVEYVGFYTTVRAS